MIKLGCKTCNKQFEALDDTNTEEPICYGCALESITGGRAPEEGDFNSARIISGEMSEQEWRWMQEDFESVDHSRAQQAWERENDYYRELYEWHPEEDYPADEEENTSEVAEAFPEMEEPEEEFHCDCIVCGAELEDQDANMCERCIEWLKDEERMNLYLLLDVHPFRAFWWAHCFDMARYWVVDPARHFLQKHTRR
jgi:hypothetical protein